MLKKPRWRFFIRFLIANRNNGTLEELVKLLDNKMLQWENVDVKKFIAGMKMVYKKENILDMWKLANKLNLFGTCSDFKNAYTLDTFDPAILEKHEMQEMKELTKEESELNQYIKKMKVGLGLTNDDNSSSSITYGNVEQYQ